MLVDKDLIAQRPAIEYGWFPEAGNAERFEVRFYGNVSPKDRLAMLNWIRSYQKQLQVFNPMWFVTIHTEPSRYFLRKVTTESPLQYLKAAFNELSRPLHAA